MPDNSYSTFPNAITAAFAASRLEVSGVDFYPAFLRVYYAGKPYADPARAKGFRDLVGWRIAQCGWDMNGYYMIFRSV